MLSSFLSYLFTAFGGFPFELRTTNIEPRQSHSFGDTLEPRYIFGAEPLDQ